MRNDGANDQSVSVLVVDDSFFMRKVICDILATDPRIKIVGQAADGLEALEKIETLHPDIMTLDVVMPHLGGLEVLQRLREIGDAPATVMVSAHTHEDAAITLSCLAAGAIDFVLKPSENDAWELQDTAADLHAKIDLAILNDERYKPGISRRAHTVRPLLFLKAAIPCEAIVIGASTGGPVALEQLLPQLPAKPHFTVLVAQHMPTAFIAALAGRLANKCQAPVRVAQNGQAVLPGTIYLCPGGATTEIINQHGPQFRIEPSTATLTPSIDTLMASAANFYADRLVSIVLTGMGEDGLAGARIAREQGGTVVVQDEASSTVFGMAKAIIDHDLADAVLPLHDIMPKLLPKLMGT